MARLKNISKAKLNNLMKSLPTPIQEHSKRCKKLAEFFIERVSTEDWFIEGKYKGVNIVTAIYYHDIGKKRIPKDNLYIEHCNTVAKKEKYKSHVEEGKRLVEEECEIQFEPYRENSLAKTLYYTIVDHHENYDGSGFPAGKKGEEISFIGRLTAVIETFDNLLFVGNANAINFEEAVQALKALAGTRLDEEIVNLLTSDEKTLQEYVKYINVREKDNHRKDRYGLQLRYRPIMNVRENRTVSLIADVVINDAYYGILPSTSFMPIAEKQGKASMLHKIAFEKLCIQLEKIALRGFKVPEVFFEVSARVLEKKNFFKDIDKLLKKYRILRSKINIVMTENSLVDYCADVVKASNEVHSLKLNFIIGDFGDQVSLISANDNLSLDGVIFKQIYGKMIAVNPKTYSIVSGIARIVEKLNIPVIFDGVGDSRGEESVMKMHVKYACGPRYGDPMTDAGLIERLKAGGLDGE